MVCLSKLYRFKYFKSCLPQISLGPFLNTLSPFRVSSNSLETGRKLIIINNLVYAEHLVYACVRSVYTLYPRG